MVFPRLLLALLVFSPLASAQSVELRPLSPSPLGMAARDNPALVEVKGWVVDEADGQPIPWLNVLAFGDDGRFLGEGTTGYFGRFYLETEDDDFLAVEPGALRLSFRDGDTWLDARCTHEFPTKSAVQLAIGPAFPIAAPEAIRGRLAESTVVCVDADGSAFPVRATVHTDPFAEQSNRTWIRFPAPLGDAYDEVRIRWGDPLAEAACALPAKRGALADEAALNVRPLAAFALTAPQAMTRREPVVLTGTGANAHVVRRAAVSPGAQLDAFDRLPPGSYRWELGVGGSRGSGTCELVGGAPPQAIVVEPAPGRPSVRIPIDISDANGLDVSALRPVMACIAEPDTKDRATPKVEASSQGSAVDPLSLVLPDMSAGTWVLRLYAIGDFEVSPSLISIVDGVPSSPLTVRAIPPRRTLRLTALDHATGAPIPHRWMVQSSDWSDAGHALSEDGSPLSMTVPSHRPSTIYVAADHYGMVKVRVHPQATADSISVLMDRGMPPTVVKVANPRGEPVAGVAVRVSGTLRGTTDAEGELMVHAIEPFGWTTIQLGEDGDGLTPILPARRLSRRGEWKQWRFGYAFVVERDGAKVR